MSKEQALLIKSLFQAKFDNDAAAGLLNKAEQEKAEEVGEREEADKAELSVSQSQLAASQEEGPIDVLSPETPEKPAQAGSRKRSHDEDPLASRKKARFEVSPTAPPPAVEETMDVDAPEPSLESEEIPKLPDFFFKKSTEAPKSYSKSSRSHGSQSELPSQFKINLDAAPGSTPIVIDEQPAHTTPTKVRPIAPSCSSCSLLVCL